MSVEFHFVNIGLLYLSGKFWNINDDDNYVKIIFITNNSIKTMINKTKIFTNKTFPIMVIIIMGIRKLIGIFLN